MAVHVPNRGGRKPSRWVLRTMLTAAVYRLEHTALTTQPVLRPQEKLYRWKVLL